VKLENLKGLGAVRPARVVREGALKFLQRLHALHDGVDFDEEQLLRARVNGLVLGAHDYVFGLQGEHFHVGEVLLDGRVHFFFESCGHFR